MRLSLVLAFTALTGCQPDIAFRDHDGSDAFHFLGPRADRLSGTYAEHSVLTFWIVSGRDLGDHQVRSADEEVLEILAVNTEEDGDLVVTALAVGEGITTLELLQASGNVRETVPVTIARPDRYEFVPRSQLLATPERGHQSDVRQLRNAEVTYAVLPYAGTQRLAGNAGITVPEPLLHDGALVAGMETRDGADHPTWLKITGRASVSASVPLHVNDEVVLSPTVHIVEPEVITGFSVEGSEAGAVDGDVITLFAQAHDAQAQPVFGPSASWVLSAADHGTGDLYVYTFDADDPNTLDVGLGEHLASMQISGRGQSANSSEVGCSTVAPRAGLLGLLLAGAALAWRRR